MAKQLAKIESIRLGSEDGRFGLWVSFAGEGWGVGDTTLWYWSGERSQNALWTEADRDAMKVKVMDRVQQLCRDAKVRYLDELKGKPVECDFGDKSTWGGTLQSWRILTEVM